MDEGSRPPQGTFAGGRDVARETPSLEIISLCGAAYTEYTRLKDAMWVARAELAYQRASMNARYSISTPVLASAP